VGNITLEVLQRPKLYVIRRGLQNNLPEEAQIRKAESSNPPASIFQEGAQSSTAAGMPQLLQGFHLNLSDPLTTEVKPAANFF
jgi:hypothetical protein